VEITSPAVPKLPVYARLGCLKIWLHDGRAPRILRLVAANTRTATEVGFCPAWTESVLSEFLEQKQDPGALLTGAGVVRTWARQQ